MTTTYRGVRRWARRTDTADKIPGNEIQSEHQQRSEAHGCPILPGLVEK